MSIPATYGILMLVGLVVSTIIWSRLTAARPIPVLVFVGGLMGAVLGAKLGYLIFEWPYRFGQPDFWMNMLVGRTVLGGILGGYFGVEWGKAQCDYRSPTGDLFALAVPLGIGIGRIGCFLHGCCLGRHCEPAWYTIQDAAGAFRYPASLTDAIFQLTFLAIAWLCYARRILVGQIFHVYMISYGGYRFISEFYRETPRVGAYFTSYQILALAVMIVGTWRFMIRQQGLVKDPAASTGILMDENQ